MRTFLYALLLGASLASSRAYAQQPALPGAPQPALPGAPQPTLPGAPQTPPAAAPAPALPADYVLGHTYQVRTRSNVEFRGRLVGLTLESLEFETTELGKLTILRTNVVQATDQDVPVAATEPGRVGLRPGYYDIGSGSRYFFGPSGRNLRAGEGVLQDVWLFLGGVNYGITDNFSIGGYLSLVPSVGLQNQFLMLTPKVGFDVGHNWSLGAGALYVRIPDGDTGIGAGLLYGAATRGSADNNFTVGLGYGFASGNVGSTPTVLLAWQTRVTRRLSLMNENYIVAAENPAFFGVYGVKVNWPRVSLGIASGYIGYVDNRNRYNGRDDSFFAFGYVYPVYLDVSYRFGKIFRAAGR